MACICNMFIDVSDYEKSLANDVTVRQLAKDFFVVCLGGLEQRFINIFFAWSSEFGLASP